MYYGENKQYYLRKNKKHKTMHEEIIREAKNKPCKDCRFCFPSVCMDFDHLKNKKFNVSQGPSRFGIKKILEEIAKCDVVCSNCHRIRTAKILLSASVMDNTSGFDPEDSTFES